MKQLIYISFIFLVISCQDIPSVEKPTDLIERDQMQDVIYEMAIVNGARGYDIQKLSKYGVAPETYIFEKYGIDSLQLAKSISYYASDIEDYKDMYLAIQERVDAEFKDYDSLAKIEKKVKDSLRTEKAKELQRERDSLKKVDSLKGKVKKSLSPMRLSKEIFIDSL